MIPKEQKGPVMMAIMGDLAGPVPSLDLGKKLSVPQDLMMEELSLRNNRGSLLFQKRQRRVQKFTFELAASQRAVLAGSAKKKVTGTAEPGMVANGTGPEGQNYRSELHILPASSGGPEDAHAAAVAAAARVESARGPSALAPGPQCHLEDPSWGTSFPGQVPPSSQSSSMAWNSSAADPASTEWPRAGSVTSQSLRICSPSLNPSLAVLVTSGANLWTALHSL
ncbi:myozenin-3 isoform X2 [Nycticebus coucang]|uniref:myozenin-3 isoform X2 n=1 Tax=Nycticebus coucang TaxID=9470 RepID=UPI00234E14E1|nr:myozenin-3 isoform X2 [Nycticebus coucang]